ncbi:CBS domain-containing protein [Catelliglobosispora koreensis]|uniref:CBS domain-containing protein n=1 Tax=Catelliglobosispora koreensis TaxID=129052 RepID=UPI00035EF347|nr:CBS domain-containing protein [Catelliglobosispora koreensis]
MAHTISEVMTPDPVCVSGQDSVAAAAKKMADYDIGDVLVTGAKGELIGVLTDRDLVVRAIAKNLDPKTTTAGEVCSPDPVKVSPSDTVAHAVELMRDKALRRLPVVEKGKLAGIVSIGDLAVREDPQSALAEISAAPPNN